MAKRAQVASRASTQAGGTPASAVGARQSAPTQAQLGAVPKRASATAAAQPVAAVGSSPPAAAATSLVTAAAARMSQLWERSVARGSRLDSHIKRRGWSGGSCWSCGGGAGCARRQHSYPHDRVSAGRPNRGRGWRSASSGRTTSSTTRGARVAQCKPLSPGRTTSSTNRGRLSIGLDGCTCAGPHHSRTAPRGGPRLGSGCAGSYSGR